MTYQIGNRSQGVDQPFQPRLRLTGITPEEANAIKRMAVSDYNPSRLERLELTVKQTCYKFVRRVRMSKKVLTNIWR